MFSRCEETSAVVTRNTIPSLDRESQAFDRKRVVKVSSQSGRHLGVADTMWQLHDILGEAQDACPNVHVEESEFELPTMLITAKVMDRVHKAINEHREKGTPISKCIRLNTMDQHMTPKTTDVSVYKELVQAPICCIFAFDHPSRTNRARSRQHFEWQMYRTHAPKL